MAKVKVKDIPDVLKAWMEKPDDFWLGKCIRSLGYTSSELAKLMKSNKKIDRAVKLAFDSLFEKVIYNIAIGNIPDKLGDFIMVYNGQRLKIVKKRDAPKLFFDCPKNGGFNDLIDEEDEEDDEEEEKKEEDLQPGEFLPLFKKVKIKRKRR